MVTLGTWSLFIVLVLGLLGIDLVIFHKKDKKIGIKNSILTSLLYMGVALIFGLWIWKNFGFNGFSEYIASFMTEQSLAIDNIFMIYLIFSNLKIPEKYQYRVLFWGVLGAILLRCIAIVVANEIITHFAWMMYVLSAGMIFTGLKIFFTSEKKEGMQGGQVLKWMSKYVHTTPEITGHRFFIKKTDPNSHQQYRVATPLWVALIVIEFSDIVFTLDSIPALFTITKNSFIIYTSNIFSILSLRSMYFIVTPLVEQFYYLKFSIALILVFIGSKIFIQDFFGLAEISPMSSLAVTFGLLLFGGLYSVYKNKQRS